METLEHNFVSIPPLHNYNTRGNKRWKDRYGINYFDEYYPSTEKIALMESLNRIETVERKDDESKKEKHFLLLVCLIISTIPFIVCDLYYALSGEPCLWKSYTEIYVSLYEYLIMSAIYSISVFATYVINLYYSDNHPSSKEWDLLEKISMYSNRMFLICWTIVGNILYWGGYCSECSFELSEYLLFSLICKSLIYSIYAASSYLIR
jgi:hypothetical protein